MQQDRTLLTQICALRADLRSQAQNRETRRAHSVSNSVTPKHPPYLQIDFYIYTLWFTMYASGTVCMNKWILTFARTDKSTTVTNTMTDIPLSSQHTQKNMIYENGNLLDIVSQQPNTGLTDYSPESIQNTIWKINIEVCFCKLTPLNIPTTFI